MNRLLLLVTSIVITTQLFAQSSDDMSQVPHMVEPVVSRYINNISAVSSRFSEKLDVESQKALKKLERQEARINRKLAKCDSTKAATIFVNSKHRYEQLRISLQEGVPMKSYIPTLDTLGTSLKFLQQTPQLFEKGKDSEKKLGDALAKVHELQDNFGRAEAIKHFLRERRQYLREQLKELGFTRELKHVNKQVYYYSEKLNEYKALLKDHKKGQRKAIELLSKTKLFRDFMRKNSQLASLFKLPGGSDMPISATNLTGLQTRVQVNNLIQQQITSGGSVAQQEFQQNMRDAQNQLTQLKNKVRKFGQGSSNAEIPEGFKPNNQKAKSFLKRLELGTNIQSQNANNFFPVTTDIGLSLGYKMNDKSIIGIGSSYKIGWGRNIRHINLTHQGVGFRTFIDWKVKGSIWATGGFECNYRSQIRNIDQLKELNAWQQSGLIGVSKIVSLKSRYFKKTKLQLLWDFLSYQQVPATQQLLFRIAYSF